MAADLAQQVLTGDPEVFHAGAFNAAAGLGSVLGPAALGLADGPAHRHLRRLMTPPFQAKAVRRHTAGRPGRSRALTS